MTTKSEPGTFDAYSKAETDEPFFTLLARDPVAPPLIEAWAYLRSGQLQAAEIAFKQAVDAATHIEPQPPGVVVGIDVVPVAVREVAAAADLARADGPARVREHLVGGAPVEHPRRDGADADGERAVRAAGAVLRERRGSSR